jgi:hypothetical protein
LGVRRFGSWIVDDAFISAAYARTLAEAGTFAPTSRDDPVEGVSNPAWTLLISLLRLVGLFDQGQVWLGRSDYVWVIRVIAIMCFVATLACFYATARTIASPDKSALASAFAGTCLALIPTYAIWSLSGLENPLFGLIAAALLLVVTRASAENRLLLPSTAVLCGFIVLAASATRPDGLILGGAYAILVLVQGRARPRQLSVAWLLYGATIVVPLGCVLLWRHAVFGLWVPNTAIAKGQSTPTLAMLVHQAGAVGAALTLPICFLMLGLLAACLLGKRPDSQTAWAIGSALTLLAFAAAGFAVLAPDWMSEFRFSTAVVVLSAGYIALASAWLLRLEPRRTFRLVASAIAVVMTLMATGLVSTARVERFLSHPTISGCFVAERYGELFNWYADQLDVDGEGSLVIPDIGGTLLRSRLHVVDLAGLTEPTIARYRGAGDMAGIRDYVLEEIKPTFIAFHEPWSAGLEQDPRFLTEYRPLGSPGDFVRRDAVPATADLLRIGERGRQLVDRQGPRAGTLGDCGSLRVGDVPE